MRKKGKQFLVGEQEAAVSQEDDTEVEDVSQLGEFLSSVHEALGLKPSTI